MIALLVMTDGRRDCIERTIPSFLDHVDRPDLLTELWVHDDSGDPTYARWLCDTFAARGFRIIQGGGRAGFGGAIRWAWHTLRAESATPFIFHLEDDFVFPRTIPLRDMVGVLKQHPHLVQMALRRQPWNPDERAAGGVVEQHPGDYIDAQSFGGYRWLEHRRFFTTNPCLYRRSLIIDHDWPDGDNSEGTFTATILEAASVEPFAYWGERSSGTWCEHIGRERIGTGY